MEESIKKELYIRRNVSRNQKSRYSKISNTTMDSFIVTNLLQIELWNINNLIFNVNKTVTNDGLNKNLAYIVLTMCLPARDSLRESWSYVFKGLRILLHVKPCKFWLV